MGVHIEGLYYIVRAGKDLHEFGDNYTFAASISAYDGVALIRGAGGVMPTSDRPAFVEALRLLGFTEAQWTRNRGKSVKMDLRLKPHEMPSDKEPEVLVLDGTEVVKLSDYQDLKEEIAKLKKTLSLFQVGKSLEITGDKPKEE